MVLPSVRPATRSDAAAVLRLLTDPALPFPPNVDEEFVAAMLEKEPDCYRDEERDTYMRLGVMEDIREVNIPEWLPQSGTPERMLPLLPVIVKATDAVLLRLPQSATWPLWGDFQMATFADSLALANAWAAYLRDPVTRRAIVTVLPSPLNPTHYARAQSTVGQVNTVARTLAVAGGLL